MHPLLRSVLLVAFPFVFVTSAYFQASSGQAGEEQDRIIEVPSFSNEPVKISELKAKGRRVRAGERFKESNDWFKGLTIKISNTSDKPVNYVSVRVIFPRPKEQKEAGRIPFGERLAYGFSPVDLKGLADSGPAPSIPPGESIELILSEKYFNEYAGVLKRLAFPDAIKRIEVILQEVGFEDGLLWSGGDFWRSDPNNHNKYVPVSKGEGKPFFLKRDLSLSSHEQELGSTFPKDTVGAAAGTNTRLFLGKL
ncbi:MAG TPA: hypothetical protein VGX48_07450 [Pyrinomonadaceae bacterium]|jgi:hypothetical protein|nr:hypothetical protein [Pyrinomonadaceae bacterium]